LEKHQNLRVVGAHLGSLEFDVDELAKRFDRFPNFAADMGARVCHFQVQDREKVRNFIIKYQDRLLYGIDVPAGPKSFQDNLDTLEKTYSNDYRYFATDQEMEVPEVNGKFRGLALPEAVLRKIYFDNYLYWFPGSKFHR
ncbi:MAG: amidohydrolase, partial [Candidatus Glassbacteria bacterium]